MEVRSFFREEGVALERMLYSVMATAVVETALVVEKSVIQILLEIFFPLGFCLEAISILGFLFSYCRHGYLRDFLLLLFMYQK